MNRQYIEALIQKAVSQFNVDMPRIQVDLTKDKLHGDFATNIALLLAKSLQRKPREIAELIVKAIPESNQIKKIEIAGPGFINFFLTSSAICHVISEILQQGENYGRSAIGKKQRVLVEFVSSNPTGPLHVGHGRHAAYGDIVANLLTAVGYDVHREYYVNDAGRQMDILAASVWVRYLLVCGETITLPANVYKGEYVIDIAEQLRSLYGDQFRVAATDVMQGLPLDEPLGGDKEIYIDALIQRAKEKLGAANYEILFRAALDSILSDIRHDLEEFGVVFDTWFSERDFTQHDAVDRTIELLRSKGLTYQSEGALWFRSTEFGDEKDRVLERTNGQRTYFTNDLAYHVNKFERGFDLAIDIFGSDHHGYVPRMKAGLQASGVAPDKLTYLFMQFVTLYRSGQQVQMSTRSGSFVTLRELRAEVGNDAARFFYVMRKSEQHVDFDLDLAKSRSNENPVYYIQYAHARICSVFRQLAEKDMTYQQSIGLQHVALLTEPQEVQLMGTLSQYSDIIASAARFYEPHILTHYLREVANDFHAYYNAHQFLIEDAHLRDARLALVSATRQVLVNGLKLLSISTPESM